MARLWRIDPAGVPRPSRTRKIRGGPLIDLAALQQAIADGALDENGVWLATRKAEHQVQDLEWTYDDLLECVTHLLPQDFKGAEWCDDRYGNTHACDAYAITYDDHVCRRVKDGCSFYLKFSLDGDGDLTLIVISCHV